jgi:alpha-beta hydrolase superfamily lysophospholipase
LLNLFSKITIFFNLNIQKLAFENMIKSTNNIQLFTKNYLTQNGKANLLIVHGLHEHCLRYAHVAEALNGIGINVYTFDLRGHGQSEGPKVNIKSVDEYREDLETVYRSIPKNIPFFILGHSMGGLIVTDFLLFNERNDVKGAILSGPALEVGEDLSPVLIKLVNLIGGIAPNLATQKLDVSLISRDKDEVDKYSNDPLIYLGGTKAGIGKALLSRINEVKSNFKNFNYPFLIMHGSADNITNIKGSKALYTQAKSTDKTFKEWEGAYHEIFNEINKQEVIAFMLNWLKPRI